MNVQYESDVTDQDDAAENDLQIVQENYIDQNEINEASNVVQKGTHDNLPGISKT